MHGSTSNMDPESPGRPERMSVKSRFFVTLPFCLIRIGSHSRRYRATFSLATNILATRFPWAKAEYSVPAGPFQRRPRAVDPGRGSTSTNLQNNLEWEAQAR